MRLFSKKLLLLVSTFLILGFQDEVFAQFDSIELKQQRHEEMLSWCDREIPEDAQYDGEVIHVGYRSILEPGEKTTVKIHVINKSSVPWFGDKSVCGDKDPVRLGAVRDDNRSSVFWPKSSFITDKNSAWLSPNRIMMKQAFVRPFEVATFEFDVLAPDEADIYKEYFKPVIENVQWFDNNERFLKFQVGNVNEEQREKLPMMQFSTRSDDIDPFERNIIVDISEQQMYVRLGERNLYIFPISTGTRRTPTPLGPTQVFFKQELRIAHAPPHYIMPLYQAFRANGAYGIHSLPSLANDRGIFWNEALNHIGEMRSHGCIRLLPWDAETLWEFTDVGVPISIQW